jgi:hypothetical protein
MFHIKVVVSSAAKAELGSLFHNGKDTAWLRTALTYIGQAQPPRPIQTDNSCASGIAMALSNKGAPKQLTCVFIGLETV